MTTLPGLVADPNPRDVASHPICLSPAASRILEFVTAHRDDHDRCSVQYSHLRLLTGAVMVNAWLSELIAYGKLAHVGFVRGGVIVQVLPPMVRVARRRR